MGRLGRAVRSYRRLRRADARAQFPVAQMRFERQIRFGGERAIEIRETLENLSAADRPIAWTQHVTLGPPFHRARRHRVPRAGHALESARERFRPVTAHT